EVSTERRIRKSPPAQALRTFSSEKGALGRSAPISKHPIHASMPTSGSRLRCRWTPSPSAPSARTAVQRGSTAIRTTSGLVPARPIFTDGISPMKRAPEMWPPLLLLLLPSCGVIVSFDKYEHSEAKTYGVHGVVEGLVGDTKIILVLDGNNGDALVT